MSLSPWLSLLLAGVGAGDVLVVAGLLLDAGGWLALAGWAVWVEVPGRLGERVVVPLPCVPLLLLP